ncbi:MAG: FAD-dependent oxidoreductase [Burkholderiales bacterium]
MRIAIVGAGIIGVTTAYELAADGHEVTVFERRGSVAAETSFANAGIVAPGYVTPWSSPGMPLKVLTHLWARHAPVRLNATLDISTLGWIWQWWRACNARRYAANRTRMQRLAMFSRERLHELTRTLRLEYERSDGFLVLLRGKRDLAAVQPGLAVLRELGVTFDELDATACLRVEPGLSTATPLHGGICLANDEVGNCRQFALLIRTQAQRLGARFRFHTAVQDLHPGARPQVTHEHLSGEETTRFGVNGDAASREGPATVPMVQGPVTEQFDAVVLCAALGAPMLLAPHGLRLPLAAVHGYSITAPLRHIDDHADIGPRSAVMDERYKVAITRLGKRVRVAGSAELGGSATRHHPGAIETLHKVLNDWYPGAARMSQAQQWKGARPMLPDGPPVLGASGIEGVWLNLGHGSSGWALACGSARVLADQIAGRVPAIDVEGLDVARLRG